MKTRNQAWPKCLVAVVFAVSCTASWGVEILVNAQLTGDVRQAQGLNPTNIVIDVTVAADTTSDTASWTVDINSPDHPDARLDEFYFNVDLTGISGVTFANVSPAAWQIVPSDGVKGVGGVSPGFVFEANDPPPGPGVPVNNVVDLTFDMILQGGATWTADMLLNAPVSASRDGGMGQLGAHVISLSTDLVNCPNGCQTDSGFAFGNYEGGGDPAVPVPGTLLLVGGGVLSGLFARRRRTQQP